MVKTILKTMIKFSLIYLWLASSRFSFSFCAWSLASRRTAFSLEYSCERSCLIRLSFFGLKKRVENQSASANSPAQLKSIPYVYARARLFFHTLIGQPSNFQVFEPFSSCSVSSLSFSTCSFRSAFALILASEVPERYFSIICSRAVCKSILRFIRSNKILIKEI